MTSSKKGAQSKIVAPTAKKLAPMPNGEDILSKGTEYYRIKKAAEILECTPDDLLHMGATGNAEIMAVVVDSGYFEWSISWDGSPSGDLEPPFRTWFDASDRVILSMSDLAQIEGRGWAIPSFFYAPAKAMALTKRWNGFNFVRAYDDGNPTEVGDGNDSMGKVSAAQTDITHEHVVGLKTYVPPVFGEKERKSNVWNSEEFFKRMEVNAVNVLWHSIHSSQLDAESAEDTPDGERGGEVPIKKIAEKTTIDHLFIAKIELQRLIDGAPRDDAALARNKQMTETLIEREHGNTLRFSKPKIAILKAAIYCLNECLDKKLTGTALTILIEENAKQFWPKVGAPPLEVSTIEETLRDALNGRI